MDLLLISFTIYLQTPLTGHQVEKRKRGGPREKVNDYPITGECTTLDHVDEGNEYKFCVAAVTQPGVGDFSLATAPVKVKEVKRKFAVKSGGSEICCF